MAESSPQGLSDKTLDDYDKLDLQECYTAIRSFLDRRIQLVVFFGTANLTLLGLAVKYQNCAMIIAAGLILLFFIVVDTLLRSNITSYLYSSYCIEKKKMHKCGLVYFHILSHTGGMKILTKFDHLYTIKDSKELSKKMRRLLLNPFGFRARLVSTTVFIMAILQIIASLYMHSKYNWLWFTIISNYN